MLLIYNWDIKFIIFVMLINIMLCVSYILVVLEKYKVYDKSICIKIC